MLAAVQTPSQAWLVDHVLDKQRMALTLVLTSQCSHFIMALHTFEVEAILFDMDGTLVDSTAAVNKTYVDFCHAHGIEVTGHPHV